jgi:hypothetical protein
MRKGGVALTLYGSPVPATDGDQEALRVRVCAGAGDLHGRLVALADLVNADAADKAAVRGWLFGAHPEQIRPTPSSVAGPVTSSRGGCGPVNLPFSDALEGTIDLPIGWPPGCGRGRLESLGVAYLFSMAPISRNAG